MYFLYVNDSFSKNGPKLKTLKTAQYFYLMLSFYIKLLLEMFK